MVKASDINKDIRSIGEKVGVAVFAYDDIHNENINNEFHYDYKKVIGKVSQLQKITPEEAEKQLLDRGILKPLPGGEYEVDVGGTTRRGGGINYGSVFFSLSSKDYQTKYHELAHSLQDKYDLFDDEKMNRLYETAEKGLKSDEDKEDKLLDKENYSLYLNEMHSETFGYAALMLRAENRRDFLWQASQAYNDAALRNYNAALSFGKTEYGVDNQNNSKFYATKSVMKPMIKAIWKIRKEGRQGEFFDENGVLKDEKLARLCEDVVIKNAYSPRTLKSFFDYKVLDGHTSEEKGWRGDTLKSLVQAPPLAMFQILSQDSRTKTSKSILKHKQLIAAQNQKIEKFVAKQVDYGNPELTALKEYERLQTKILLIDRKFPGKYIRQTLNNRVQTGLPDCSIRKLADLYGKKTSEKKAIEKEFKSLRKIINENKGNPYFEKLVQSMPKSDELRWMIQEKQQNPQKEVTSGLTGEKKDYGFATYPIRRTMECIEDFAEKYRLNPEIKKSLLTSIVKNPHYLDNVQNRDILISSHHISNDFLGMKKKKFVKDFNHLMDEIVDDYYLNRKNPLYREVLQVLSEQPTEKYAEKIALMEKQEREARKNKEPVSFADEKQTDPTLGQVHEDVYGYSAQSSSATQKTMQSTVSQGNINTGAMPPPLPPIQNDFKNIAQKDQATIIHSMRMGHNLHLEQQDNAEQKSMENGSRQTFQEVKHEDVKEAPAPAPKQTETILTNDDSTQKMSSSENLQTSKEEPAVTQTFQTSKPQVLQNVSKGKSENHFSEAAGALIEQRAKWAYDAASSNGTISEEQKEWINRRKEREMQMAKVITKVMEERGSDLFVRSSSQSVENTLKEQALKDGLLVEKDSALFGKSVKFNNGGLYIEYNADFYGLAVGIAKQKMDMEIAKLPPEKQQEAKQGFYSCKDATQQAAFAMKTVANLSEKDTASEDKDMRKTLQQMRLGHNPQLDASANPNQKMSEKEPMQQTQNNAMSAMMINQKSGVQR